MFTQKEIEDFKKLPEYDRVGGVVHRINDATHSYCVDYFELPAVNHERFRCSRYGHVYVAFSVGKGWFQFGINMDADTKIFKDWEPSNRVIDAFFIVPWQSVKCIKIEYHCNVPYYALSFGSNDLPVLKFNSREEAELLRDAMFYEWYDFNDF